MWQYYMSQFEYIIFIRKWKWVKINNCWTSDILNIQNIKLKDGENKNLHDTEKPIELNKILILNSSNVWQTILDPFMWIWAAGIACKKLWRDFIWIELDEWYFNIAKERIESA